MQWVMDYASYYENNLSIKSKSAIYYADSDNTGINRLVQIWTAVKNKGNSCKNEWKILNAR